jgi:TonB family protein
VRPVRRVAELGSLGVFHAMPVLDPPQATRKTGDALILVRIWGVLVRCMRAALCVGLILIGSTVAFAKKPQPSPAPRRVTLTPAEAARVGMYTPKIQYPLAARARGIQGVGMFRLHVLQTGRVKSLEIEQSTGHAILDTAGMNTLGTWRFKPERLQALADAVARRSGELIIRVPVIYTM